MKNYDMELMMRRIFASVDMIEEKPIERKKILSVFKEHSRLYNVIKALDEVGLSVESCSLKQLYDMLLATDMFVRSEDYEELVSLDITTNPMSFKDKMDKFNYIKPELQSLGINRCIIVFCNEVTFPDDCKKINKVRKCYEHSIKIWEKIEEMREKDVWVDWMKLDY